MKRLRKYTWILGVWMAVMSHVLPASAADVTMNFSDADIRSVIKFVAEFSGKNFLVDNRVKGKVTIVSPSAISSEDAYRVFLSILEINGFTAIESGGVVKIIPLAEGKQKNLPVRVGGGKTEGDELVTSLIPLRHANAQQMVAVLRPLMSPNSNMTAYVPANILILTDSASNTEKIRHIVRTLDVSEAIGVRIMKLKYASAEKVAKTLAGLYGQGLGAAFGAKVRKQAS